SFFSTSLSENEFSSIPIHEGAFFSTFSSVLILCLEKILSIGLLPIHGLLAIHGLFIINHFLTDELKNICIFKYTYVL
ncbi:hypothetical protein COM32_21495, partial [Bacillus pseudomycoides]